MKNQSKYLFIYLMSIAGFSSQRALYFDGVDDYANTTNVVLTDADWTIEFDFLSASDDGTDIPLIDALPGTAGDGVTISLNNGAVLMVDIAKQDPYSSSNYQASGFAIKTGRHYHVALTYESSTQTLTFYINGKQQPSISGVVFPTQIDGRVFLGRNDAYGNGNMFHGFLDDIVFSQALRYTSDFVPETSTPTVDADTVFLVACEDANSTATLIDSSVSGNDLTREGGMRTLPYTTPDLTMGWGRFNGVSAIAETPAFAFDTATGFTIEFDIRPEDPSMDIWDAAPRVLGQADNIDEDSDNGFYIYLDHATSPASLNVDFHSAGTMSTFTIAYPPYDEWTRVALIVPAGSSLSPRAYANGSASYSSAASIPLAHYNSDVFQIGGLYDFPMARMDLDNLRITEGEAYALGDYQAFPLPDDSNDMLAFYDFESSSGVPVTSTDIGFMSVDEVPFGSTLSLVSTDITYYTCNKFLLGLANWSFDFFMSLDSMGSEMVIWDSHSTVNGSGVLLYVDASGIFHVTMGGSDQDFPTFTFSAGQEYYVFVGYEEDYESGPGSGTPHLTLYVDGNRVEDKEVGAYIESTDPVFYMGSSSVKDHFLDGTLDTFRVSRITRHSPDLSAFIVPEGPTHIDTPVAAQWLFEEGSGAPSYADETGNGHTLTQCVKLAFTQYPGTNQIVCEGETVNLIVQATDPSAGFSWYKDGALILGENASVLALGSVSVFDDGEYHCTIANNCSLSHGALISLTVNPGMTVNSVFGDGDYCSGDDITLTVDVTSSSAMTYEWRKNDIVLPSETDFSLVISGCIPGDTGNYRCIVETAESCVRAFTGLVSVEPYLIAVEQFKTICDPGGSADLFSLNVCDKPGSVLWTGPGTIINETSYTPSVQPGSTGIFTYAVTFTPDDGGEPLVRNVTVTVIDSSIFSTPELSDIWEMAAFWRAENMVEYDFSPADFPDGILDIRDMILVINCPDYIPSE